MKRKFSKILGVGLTLALLASLILTAAPVSALTVPTVVPASATISTPTTYTVTFNLGKELGTVPEFEVFDKGDSAVVGTATWALDDGEYVAHLSTGVAGSGTIPQDFVSVVVPYNAALSTITELGYSYKIVDGRPANDSAPYLLLELDTTDNDTADTWVVHQMFVTAAEATWGTWLLSTDTLDPAWHKFPNDVDYANWAAVKAAFDDDTVLNVKVCVGEWNSDHLESHYVDNIKINTATYNLEPDTITITFPVGTIVPEELPAGATLVASPGWIRGEWDATPITGAGVSFDSDATKRTVTATLLNTGDEIGEGATVRIEVPGITNPPTIGTYNLTVKTSAETTAVASADYSITTPTILPLPGVVERYNTAGVLMAQTNSIQNAIDDASKGDSINVGAGTYDEAITINESITITGDAATTIIKDTDGLGTGGTVDIQYVPTAPTVAGVVFDGFTVMGRPGVTALTITGHRVTVQNCIFTKAGTATTALGQSMVSYAPTPTPTLASTITNCIFDTTLGIVEDTGVLIVAGATGLTVSNNTFVVDGAIGAEDSAVDTSGAGALLLAITISGNTISGASGIGVTFTDAAGVATASDNTLTGLNAAFEIVFGTATIKGNTIDNCGLAINTTTALLGQAAIIVGTPTALSITNNTITNCPNDIIEIAANSANINMMFNNLTNNAMGIDNNEVSTSVTLNATHNWWGEATGPATDFNVTLGAVNDTTAYLGGEATGSFTSAAVKSLLTKKTVGVDVILDVLTTEGDIIGVANYAANPQDATPLPALDGGFYDVYLREAEATVSSVLIKFYNANVTANTKIYVWGTIAGGWVAVDTPAGAQGVNLYTGYAFVTIGTTTTPSITDLAGTPFALVAAPLGALTAPQIMSPDLGERDIPLTPTFAWTQIAAADAYYFEFADNANFVLPMVKLDGDLGRLIVTAYAHVTELSYSSAYYWRVKAVSGTVALGNLAESGWSTGVFITMDEPEEPTPPIEIVEAPTLPDITITQPDITIEPPDVIVPQAELPITPTWIYVIIAVGAVLVISVVVLIVRTRRVA